MVTYDNIMTVLIIAAACLFVLVRMAQKARKVFFHDPRKPAKYRLVPRNVIAYRWLGQETPDICHSTECFGLADPHIHQPDNALRTIEGGQWVCWDCIEGKTGRLVAGENVSRKAWVADDGWFAENYQPGE
jgi:hypothetical protein